MIHRLIMAIVVACWSSHVAAAPWLDYGGRAEVFVFGASPRTTPNHAPRVSDRTTQAAMFEALYRLGDGEALDPVLAAGPPEIVGETVFVPLRKGVRLHDGRVLTPALAAASLRSKRSTAAGHVLAPLVGAPEGRPSVRADTARHGLVFELLAPYPPYVRLLASAHAALGIPSSEAGRLVGSGPFAFGERSARGALRLDPFLPHRDGRPYLDALEVRVTTSRSSAVSWLRRGGARILLEPPDARASHRAAGRPPPFPWVRRVLRAESPEIAALASRALIRDRLVRRFMGPHAQPARRLFADLPTEPEAPVQPGSSAPLELLVGRTDRLGWQFAKRVQLDLVRAGLSGALRRMDSAELSERLVAPRRALVLAPLLPDAPHSARPTDRFHALLSICAALGSPHALDRAEIAAFMGASAAQRREMLPKLESAVRSRLNLVVIAVRPAGSTIDTPIQGLREEPHGALRFDDATIPESRR